MVANAVADDIDDYPPVGDFKSKALSTNERLLLARNDSNQKEAFPVHSLSLGSGFGDLVRCAFEEPSERATGMCLALTSTAGPFLAYGLSNGSVSIHRLPVSTVKDGGTSRLPAVFSLKATSAMQAVNHPITSLSWIHAQAHPDSLQNVLACTHGASVSLHHATTSKLLASFTPQADEEGSAMSSEEALLASAASHRTSGIVAVGGTEGSIFVLDCNGSSVSKRESLKIPPTHAGAVGQAHASRVFTVRWHPDDPNTLFSGGWDKFVKVWDLRSRRPTLTIPGPLLCGGTAADVCPGTHILATASWRLQDPLQLWDLRTAGLLTNLPLALDGSPPAEPPVDIAAIRQPGRAPRGSAAGGAGRGGAHLHGLRPYSVVWLGRGVLACGGSGVRHGLRVLKSDGTAVASAACSTVHDLAPFWYADGSTGVAAACAGGLTLLPPVVKSAQ